MSDPKGRGSNTWNINIKNGGSNGEHYRDNNVTRQDTDLIHYQNYNDELTRAEYDYDDSDPDDWDGGY